MAISFFVGVTTKSDERDCKPLPVNSFQWSAIPVESNQAESNSYVISTQGNGHCDSSHNDEKQGTLNLCFEK